MEPEILLYIGGCADGERRKTTHHKMMVTKFAGKVRPIESMSDDIAAREDYFTQHLYRMARFHVGGQAFSVMVWDGMTHVQMFDALLSKYPVPKDDD